MNLGRREAGMGGTDGYHTAGVHAALSRGGNPAFSAQQPPGTSGSTRSSSEFGSELDRRAILAPPTMRNSSGRAPASPSCASAEVSRRNPFEPAAVSGVFVRPTSAGRLQ
eukprot:295191-Chlamydomonas_euryale.AAC.3